MIGRIAIGVCIVVPGLLGTGVARAQDVPGIEICTVEKTMERRTSCLQSNVEFLQKTIAKLTLDHQQKLDAAKAQIEALKANLATLQKAVGDLQVALKATIDPKKTDAPPAKETTARETLPKETLPKDGAAKASGK